MQIIKKLAAGIVAIAIAAATAGCYAPGDARYHHHYHRPYYDRVGERL
jgi:hypothetical protein